MLPGEIRHPRDLRLGNFIGIYAAHSDTLLMHVERDPRRFLAVFIEKAFEDIDDKRAMRNTIQAV